MIILDSVNFIDLINSKLMSNAQINLEGCNTARWSNNISQELSRRLHDVNVRGYRGFGFSNMIFGGNSRIGIGKTYRNGEVQ